MDIIATEQELRELAEKQREMCEQYFEARKRFGEAKLNLTVLLVPHQEEKDYRKASFEKQLLMLLADTPENHKPEVYGYYREYIEQEQRYKGLEKIIEAYASRISSLQSLMKWEKQNVPFG